MEAIRNLQVKNFLTVTMVSLGFPLILMGDEMRRTQRRNNNAWCQDNEISWLDWDLLAKHADVYRFIRLLNQHRLMRSGEAAESRVSLNELLGPANMFTLQTRVTCAAAEGKLEDYHDAIRDDLEVYQVGSIQSLS